MRYVLGEFGVPIPDTDEIATSIAETKRHLDRLVSGLQRNTWLVGPKPYLAAQQEARADILRLEREARAISHRLASMIELAEEE